MNSIVRPALEVNMNIRDIVTEYLNTHGFDGLYYSAECACKKDDLMPCSGDVFANDCQPGYLCPCDPVECGEHDWHIGATRVEPAVAADPKEI